MIVSIHQTANLAGGERDVLVADDNLQLLRGVFNAGQVFF